MMMRILVATLFGSASIANASRGYCADDPCDTGKLNWGMPSFLPSFIIFVLFLYHTKYVYVSNVYVNIGGLFINDKDLVYASEEVHT